MVNKPPGCLIAFGLCLALSLGWIAPAGAYAQVLYASITGNVADSTGARVPGAEVKIVNPDTNYTQSAVSNETGIYTIKNVPGGTYTLTVTMTGFKEYEAKNVSVTVGNVTRHDVALQIGQISDTVSETGAATLLQADTADVHVQLETKEITNLPLGAYRNYQTLINLVPGATPSEFQNAVTDTPMRSLTTNVNGTARNSNNTRLDGATTVLTWLPHHVSYVAPQESIQTVNISTNNFDAEQGLAGGAAITVQTKSGTNELHAVAFEYLQNSATSARNFFTPAGSGVPKYINNMFG